MRPGVLPAWLACAAMTAGFSETAGVERGVLPATWPARADCAGVPPFHAHDYNADFIILRQSGCTNFEKPFLYLIVGADKALLVDTGATGADPAPAVTAALRQWAERHERRVPPLVVIHSHNHGDHVAGDAHLKALDGTTLVGADRPSVEAFFGIRHWPDEVVTFDLGNRAIDVIPIPGHEAASIALYDRRTGILLTGDTLYPGRLYVRDGDAFRASVRRLVAFTEGKVVAHVLGTHIENTRTPFVDYLEGTKYQPDEHVLELGRAHLLELQDALGRMPGPVERHALRDFTIWPVAPR